MSASLAGALTSSADDPAAAASAVTAAAASATVAAAATVRHRSCRRPFPALAARYLGCLLRCALRARLGPRQNYGDKASCDCGNDARPARHAVHSRFGCIHNTDGSKKSVGLTLTKVKERWQDSKTSDTRQAAEQKVGHTWEGGKRVYAGRAARTCGEWTAGRAAAEPPRCGAHAATCPPPVLLVKLKTPPLSRSPALCRNYA